MKSPLSIREAKTLAAAESDHRPTQAELAERFGVSQAAIAQRLARARAKKYGGRFAAAVRSVVKPISLALLGRDSF